MNSGRDIILKKLKKDSMKLVITGSILAFITFAISIIMMIAFVVSCVEPGDGKDFAPLAVISALFFLLGIGGVIMIVVGARRIKDPSGNSALKNNEDLLYMADELYAGITYQDENLIMSDRVVANKKNPLQIAFYNEVFLVYVHTETYNFITTTKQLVLATARDEILINIMRMKKDKVNQLAETVASKCPYARFGYNQQNLQYLDEMRKVWKRAKLDQAMGITKQQVERDRLQHEQAIASGQQAYYNPDQKML